MKELKVKEGDRIIYTSGGFHKSRTITTVTKVTPTGRIRVACSKGAQFSKHGYEMGITDTWSPRAYLTELTPELEQEVMEENTIKLCFKKMADTKKLNYQTALKILEALEDLENGKGAE